MYKENIRKRTVIVVIPSDRSSRVCYIAQALILCLFTLASLRKCKFVYTRREVTNIDTIESRNYLQSHKRLQYTSPLVNRTYKNIYSSSRNPKCCYKKRQLSLSTMVLPFYDVCWRVERKVWASRGVGEWFRSFHAHVARTTEHGDHVDVQMNEQQHEQNVPSLLLRVLQPSTGIEFEEDDVAVLDHVVAPLLPVFSGSLL